MKQNKQNKKSLAIILFILYIALLVSVIFFRLPFSIETLMDETRGIVLFPQRGSFLEYGFFLMRELFLNILIFIPFGIYLSILIRKTILLKKVILILGFTILFEIIYFIITPGQINMNYFFSHISGGLLGIAIHIILFKIFRNKTVKIINASALIVMLCIALFFLYHFVMPPAQALPAPTNTSHEFANKESVPLEIHENIPESTAQKTENILLVNADNPLPINFQPENLVNLFEQENRYFELAKADIKLCESVFQAMNTMFEAAQADGVSGFIITSGYRSRTNQEEIYAESIDGFAAKPGESEHETGLAFDVVAMGDENFALTPQFEWLSVHCATYGFIIRYPEGKENITGISYESWHYRYVGVSVAKEIMQRGITLEEYLNP